MTIEEALALAGRECASGQLKRGEEIYRRVLELQPQSARAKHGLGRIAAASERWEEAIEFFREARKTGPDDPAILVDLGAALLAINEIEPAIDAFSRALTLRPDLAELHYNLGHALQKAGRIDAAMNEYRQALQKQPDLVAALTNLGNILLNKGDFAAANECLGRVVAVRPDLAEGHNNFGNALMLSGDCEQGIAQLKRAVEISPRQYEWRLNLANAFQHIGRWEEAAAQYREAVTLRPSEAGLYASLGYAHFQAGDLEHAAAAFCRVTEFNSKDAGAWSNLAAVRLRLGQCAEAEAAGRRAVELAPQSAMAHTNLAAALQANGLLDETIAHYEQSLAIAPDAAVASNRIMALHLHPDYDAAALLGEQREWERLYARPVMPARVEFANDRSPRRRLRVGYVSGDLREHPVGWSLFPLLSHHDREQFEIFSYSTGRKKDALTERLASYCQGSREISRLNDEDAAKLVREDRIDVLVDLSGHAAMNRLLLFARKPAPVQVFWLSYPGGTGLSCIDYRLSDPHIDPPGSEADYTETTLRLPTTYWCYQPGGEAPQRSDVPMKTEGMITFGSLTNFAKVGAAALELWAKVLAATPRSRLLMNCPKGTARQRVSERLAGHGIAPDRLDFVSHQPWPQYMETYQRIDIALDPTPYGGGITTCDSLWMGVPVVTLLGRTAVGRGATSVLRNIQLAELIATTPVDYVRIATELARDTDRLMALRGELPSRMQASALMDARKFARDVEAAYRQMWHTTCGTKQSVA